MSDTTSKHPLVRNYLRALDAACVMLTAATRVVCIRIPRKGVL